MQRVVLVIAAALMLAGCNLVVSHTPVFRAADAAGAPPLKPGLWAAPDPGCQFNAGDPLDKWPQCANGAMLRPDAIVGTLTATGITPAQGQAPDGPKQVSLPYILAAGDPRVMQVDLRLPELGEVGVFYFVAFHPTAFDADGSITAAEAWPVQCGPPPRPRTRAPHSAISEDTTNGIVTSRPLPGLKIDKGVCHPVDKAAVLNAAGPSRAWVDRVGEMRWVRAAER